MCASTLRQPIHRQCDEGRQTVRRTGGNLAHARPVTLLVRCREEGYVRIPDRRLTWRHALRLQCVRARVCVRASAGACVDVCSAIPAILCACVRLSIGGKGEKRLTRRYRETSAQRCYLCPTLLCTLRSLRAVQGCDSCCPAEATPPPPTILLCAKAAWRFAQCNSPAAIQTQHAFTLRSHDIISWAHAIWRTLHEDHSAEQVPAEQLAEAVHVGVTHQIAANDMNGRCFWGCACSCACVVTGVGVVGGWVSG
jgi:hypothetical protein